MHASDSEISRLFDELSPLNARERALHAYQLDSLNPDAQALLGRLLARSDLISGSDGALSGRMVDVVMREAFDTSVLPTIDRYEISGEIGEGGHGTVYLARAEGSTKRWCAVKVLRAGLDATGALRRFEAERAALSELDHPAIVPITDAGKTADGRPFFAMPFVEGEAIHVACEQQSLSAVNRVKVFLLALAGVAHAHRRGILHRDLKPGNILAHRADDSWRVRVIDWGLARALDGSVADVSVLHSVGTGATIGTPEFMSPEQAAAGSEGCDERSDIWSLGATLYNILTQELPFARTAVRGLSPDALAAYLRENRPAPPSRVVDDLHRALALRGDLDAIVMKAMEPDPANRYANVECLIDDLEAYLEGRSVVARAEPAWRGILRIARRNRVIAIAIVIASVSLLAALGLVSSYAFESRRSLKSAQTTQEFLEQFILSVQPLLAKEHDRSLVVAMLRQATARLPEADAQDPIGSAQLRLTLGNAWIALGYSYEALEVASRGVVLLEPFVEESDPRLRGLLALTARAELGQALDDRFEATATRVLQSGTWPRNAPYPCDPLSCEVMASALTRAYVPSRDGTWIHGSASKEVLSLQDSVALLNPAVEHIERECGADSLLAFSARLSRMRVTLDWPPMGEATPEIIALFHELEGREGAAPIRAGAFTLITLGLSMLGRDAEIEGFVDAELPALERVLGMQNPSLLIARFNRLIIRAEAGRLQEAAEEGLEIARVFHSMQLPTVDKPAWVRNHVRGIMEQAQRLDLLEALRDDYLAACQRRGIDAVGIEEFEAQIARVARSQADGPQSP